MFYKKVIERNMNMALKNFRENSENRNRSIIRAVKERAIFKQQRNFTERFSMQRSGKELQVRLRLKTAVSGEAIDGADIFKK
jgi:hypothetical protein